MGEECNTSQAIYPIIEGQLHDEKALERLLCYILEKGLQLGPSLSDVTLLLIIPGDWNRKVHLTLLRMLLGRLKLSGVWLGEAPMMVAFGCACPTAVVIDIGGEVTEIAVIVEGEFQYSLYTMLPLGGRTIDQYLIQQVPGADLEWARALRESAHLYSHPASKVAEKKTEDDTEGGEEASISFQGKNIPTTLTETMFSPLFQPGTGLLEAIRELLLKCDTEHRLIAFDHLILTGGTSRHPLLALELRRHLAERVVTISGNAGEHQLRLKSSVSSGISGIELKTVPTFYPDIWQKATPLAAWFGGGMVAKCVLGDPKSIYTQEDWQQHGEKILYNKLL